MTTIKILLFVAVLAILGTLSVRGDEIDDQYNREMDRIDENYNRNMDRIDENHNRNMEQSNRNMDRIYENYNREMDRIDEQSKGTDNWFWIAFIVIVIGMTITLLAKQLTKANNQKTDQKKE